MAVSARYAGTRTILKGTTTKTFTTMTKVIYITPDCVGDWYIDEIKKMPTSELMTFARNTNEVEVYTLEQFQSAFNNEQISDLGYILFVDDCDNEQIDAVEYNQKTLKQWMEE